WGLATLLDLDDRGEAHQVSWLHPKHRGDLLDGENVSAALWLLAEIILGESGAAVDLVEAKPELACFLSDAPDKTGIVPDHRVRAAAYRPFAGLRWIADVHHMQFLCHLSTVDSGRPQTAGVNCLAL